MNTPAKTYLTVFLILSAPAILSIGVFNYLIDPFGYFETAPILHLNEKKLPGNAQERFDRVVKIISKKPQAIMLGSSRVRAGFQTSYYGQLTGVSAYKAAFSGARFNEIFGYFEHALYHQPQLKAVFIGIDFFAFSKNLTPIAEYSETRMKKPFLPLDDFFKLLFSYSTLKLSYATYQHNQDPRKMEKVGRIHVKIDDQDYVDLGTPMIETPQDFLKAEKRMIFDKYELDEKKIEMFRQIVRTCKEKNIDLKVVFCPAHVLYLETIYQSGLGEQFENLKRILSAIYPVYDFSGHSSFNQEPLLKETAGTYFFEMSHFTPHYGNAILDKIYGIEDRCPHTGFLLTEETVEEHLETLKQQREDWLKSHPQEIAWLKNLSI